MSFILSKLAVQILLSQFVRAFINLNSGVRLTSCFLKCPLLINVSVFPFIFSYTKAALMLPAT